jgi:hypothetical protein
MANWKVSHIEVQDVGDLTGVIVKARFEVSDSDQGRNGFANGEVTLLAPNADAFTAFDAVQHDQAVAWVKEVLGEAVAAYEAQVKKQIDSQPVPKPEVALPWMPKSELPVPKR